MSDFIIKSPEEQTDLFGHDQAQKTLLDLWNNKHLAGSWLFCGPKGIGKATLAYRLARFILAQPAQNEINLFGAEERPVSLAISEQNPVFKSVEQRMNPGLRVVECALKEDEVKNRQSLIDAGKPLDPGIERKRKRFDEIRIADIREAEAFLHLTAGANGWRVMIIDAADDMNVNAANALLKSLEEPPPKTVIILISHQPGKLLPTIRSRCRKLLLKPIKNSELRDILQVKIQNLSDQDCQALTLLSEGSPGKAVSLYEQNGCAIFKQMLALFSDFPKISVPTLYDFTEKSLKDKNVMKMAQTLLLQWLSRVCIYFQKNEYSEIFPSEKQLMQKVLTSLDPLRLMEIINEIQKTFADTDLDQKQVFANAFLTLQREAISG
ncbi:MAG: DNA polymerase III subunit delta' [Alphaproteobacteria bacterium]|nr:DNA polymerase III subunit delta' [Alphaproteobacteria bacterium]